MNRWLVPICAGAVVLGSVAWVRFEHRQEYRVQREQNARQNAGEEVRQRASAAVIPKFELRNAGFEEALAYLRREAAAAGFPYDIVSLEISPEEARRSFRRRIYFRPEEMSARPGVGEQTMPESKDEALITVSLTQLPVVEAARYVAALADRRTRVTARGIEFTPLLRTENGTAEPLVKREFSMEVGRWLPPDRETRQNATSGSIDVRRVLADMGVEFYEGTSATYTSSDRKLVVVNTEENCDLVDALTVVTGDPPATFFEQALFRLRSLFHREPKAPAPPLPSSAAPGIPGLEPLPGAGGG